MITYPIGVPAEKIVGLTINRLGTITLVRRQRKSDDRFVDLVTAVPRQFQTIIPLEFVVRVKRDHAGVLEIAPEAGRNRNMCTIIPLGPERPFLESELPPSPGANGAFSIGSEVRFEFANDTLTWTTPNLSGRMELSERVPAVAVFLHLRTGHDGELVFSASHSQHPADVTLARDSGD